MSTGGNAQLKNVQQVQKLLENELSSDEDAPIPAQVRISPVIAPMSFGKTQTQLKRRYFSTGAKRSGYDSVKDPAKLQQNEINNLLFAHKNAQNILNSEIPTNLFQNQHDHQSTNKNHPNSSERPPVVQDLINKISNSDTLNQQNGFARKLVRAKPFSGNPINKDKLYMDEPQKPSKSQVEETKQAFMLTSHLNSLLNETYDETEPIEPPVTARQTVELRPSPSQQDRSTSPPTTATRSNATKTLTRTRNAGNITQTVFNQQQIAQDVFGTTGTQNLGQTKNMNQSDTYKYKELQSTAQYVQIANESAAVQKAFRDQFRLMQAGETQLSPKLSVATTKTLTATIRPGMTLKDPTMKHYDKMVIADVIRRLSNVEDWMVSDRALKEISRICAEQPDVLLYFADPADIFSKCPRLLVDLRSALVTSTLLTLHAMFQTYTHTNYLLSQQGFIIQLLRKAGNPSLPDFMAQQADQTLLAALRNSICALNCPSASIQQLLQAFQLEALLPAAPPGVRFRAFYFITDVILLGSSGVPSAAVLVGPLIQQTEERYSLTWTKEGLAWDGGAYKPTGEPDAVKQRLAKQISKLEGFITQAVTKYCQDAHPEVRRSARRLYHITKVLGLQTTENEKADAIIRREGIADTWWGRS